MLVIKHNWGTTPVKDLFNSKIAVVIIYNNVYEHETCYQYPSLGFLGSDETVNKQRK